MNVKNLILSTSITGMLLTGMALLSPLAAFADDVPLPPASFRAADGGDRYTFSWSKVGRTGVNGQSVNPDNVTYVLEALNENYEPQRVLQSDNKLNYTLFYPVENGEQDIMRFRLYARNAAGRSDYVYTRVVTGAPYNLPFRESFATGATRGLCWQEGDGTFGVTKEESADGDAGCLVCIPASDGSASSFNFGKIILQHSMNPRLSFRMYGLAEGETLAVKIARPDGQEGTIFTVKGPVDDWTLYTVDLKGAMNQKYIIPKFQLGEGNEEAILLDDIKVEDPYTADLAVLVKPQESAAGNATVKVFAENVGLTECEEAAVAVYLDGVPVKTLKVEKLPAGETAEFEVTVPVGDSEPKEVKAVVEWAFDLNPYNDIATAQIVVEEMPDAEPNQGAGVDAVAGDDAVNSVYTIDGRKLNVNDITELTPGLYIINGKKIIVRR